MCVSCVLAVSWGVYLRYCEKAGSIIRTVLAVALVAGEGVYMASEWWLAQWA